MSDDEAAELFGRMYEAIDIQLGIESGQFKTLDDVLVFARASAEAFQAKLDAAGVPMARSVSMEEFERREKEVLHHLLLVDFDNSKATAN